MSIARCLPVLETRFPFWKGKKHEQEPFQVKMQCTLQFLIEIERKYETFPFLFCYWSFFECNIGSLWWKGVRNSNPLEYNFFFFTCKTRPTQHFLLCPTRFCLVENLDYVGFVVVLCIFRRNCFFFLQSTNRTPGRDSLAYFFTMHMRI